MYNTRGFKIDMFHIDNKFNLDLLREDMRPESLNIYAKDNIFLSSRGP